MNVESDRASSRAPLTDSEAFFAEVLGRQLRSYREDAGLTRRELAAAAMLSAGQLGRIEWGTRRTRRSTLTRIAWALHGSDADPSALEAFVDELVGIAGPALAAESEYAERVGRRRERRFKKVEKAEDKVVNDSLPMARNLAVAAVDHHERTGRWPDWMVRP